MRHYLKVEEGETRVRVSRFTWIVCVLVIGLLLGVGPISAAPPSKIVVYSGMDEYTMNVLTKAFEPMTGIKVESLVLAAAGTMAARVRSEASAPKADIFIGGSAEIHAPLARDGIFIPSNVANPHQKGIVLQLFPKKMMSI